jgi:hypothetical protein
MKKLSFVSALLFICSLSLFVYPVMKLIGMELIGIWIGLMALLIALQILEAFQAKKETQARIDRLEAEITEWKAQQIIS